MFVQNLRAKVGARLNGDSEAGFTLIELLVVMLTYDRRLAEAAQDQGLRVAAPRI